MVSEDGDPDLQSDPKIQRFATNDIFFRRAVTFGEYAALPTYQFADIPDEAAYKALIKELPSVLMIDLRDIRKFLRTINEPGFDAVDVEYIASIVCDYMGTNEDMIEVLWSNIDDDIISDITARLGVDVDSPMLSGHFNKTLTVVMEITQLVERYLVNAGYPLIDGRSVYTSGDYQNGILALRLRTYVELQQDR